jgi:class 3 adenylate cyclase
MGMPATHYVEVDGAYVAYHVTGEGPLDLLLYTTSFLPIEAMTDPLFAPVIDRLATFSRVIRFDRRGAGLSDPFSGEGAWVMERGVEDALAVLDFAGSDSCAVVACNPAAGMGALMMAAGHPDRVSALVLPNPSPRIRRGADFAWGLSAEEAARVLDIERLLTNKPFGPRRHAPDIEEWYVRTRRRGGGPASQRAAIVAWLESDVRALLPAVQAPTLVLQRADVRTPTSSPEIASYVADHVPHARYVEVPGDELDIYLGEVTPVLDEIEAFLTGVRPQLQTDRVLVTLLMTDIVESTSAAASMGDKKWRELLDRHDAIVFDHLDRHRGTKVNSIGLGDGVLATFDGPARACRCARAMNEAITTSLGIDIRAGLHTGEIEVRGDDVTGMAVNITARVMNLANANETLVSRTVTDLVAGSGLEFENRGDHALKGVPGTWTIYAIRA